MKKKRMLESITDKELDLYESVFVVTANDPELTKSGVREYILNREQIFLPRNANPLSFKIIIVKCRVGEKFIFKLCDKLGTVMISTSGGKVKSIEVSS
ncbi:MAG: hypothetical protein ABIG60_02945 [Patescibacteria group bacterium]